MAVSLAAVRAHVAALRESPTYAVSASAVASALQSVLLALEELADPSSDTVRPIVTGVLQRANKHMTCLATTDAYQKLSNATISIAPAGYVEIEFNGLAQMELGDAVRTKDCYFSRAAAPYSNGAQALAISDVADGDALYRGDGLSYPTTVNDWLVLNYEA